MTKSWLRLCQIDPPHSPCYSAMVSFVRNALLRFGFASLALFVTYLPVGLIGFCLLGTISPVLGGSPMENEVEIVEKVITASELQLAAQKKLKELMQLFQEQQEQFFMGDQSKKHAFAMVKTASQILEIITTQHMQHLFTSKYLEELALFSSIASKSAPSRP